MWYSSECIDLSRNAFVRKQVVKTTETIERIQAAIANNFMFNALDPDQQRDIIDAMEEKLVNALDVVIQQVSSKDTFF